MRLDKLLANMGVGSRKEVKDLIRKKRVTINGEIAKNGRNHVDADMDQIKVDGKLIVYKKYIYIMLNKSPGYISATRDAQEKTVIDLLSNDIKQFEPFPVGRLDKDTEGLLLITNDGQLAHELTSPTKEVEKEYFAKINGEITPEHVQVFSDGITLDDGYEAKPAHLEIISSSELSEIKITITEGKFHQVKRMFKAIGKEVVYLKRIRMGDIILDEALPLGSFRELTKAELAYCQALK